uniref:SEFIR domain-containing protein n=2 Tax=Caenorhabditis tropicalis TaxID=1561998 RepID=A0A1I7UZD3_9PELO
MMNPSFLSQLRENRVRAVMKAKIEKPPPGTNDTVASDGKTEKEKSIPGTWTWHSYAITGGVILGLGFGISICFCLKCYKKFQKTKKASNVHILNENPAFSHSGSIPLIMKQKVSVLIIYSHDSAQHEAAVLAFAELLRDVFYLNVHLDTWDDEDIEANRAEYINSSIVRADKLIIVNSIGAYYRTIFRYKREPALERVVRGRNDGIFSLQADLAMQHPSVISCHFSYTNPKYVLFPLSRHLQYSIPDNMMTMISSLTGQPARQEQLAGFNQTFARLQAAVSRKAHYIESDPQWFENTHHRVAEHTVDEMEEIPLPPSLRVQEEEFDEMETLPIDELEKKFQKVQEVSKLLDDLEVPESEKVEEILPDSPASQDPDPDPEDEEEEDMDSLENIESARIEELQRLIVNKDMNHDSGNLDSAYVSGSDFSTDIHTDIIDKPRLNNAESNHRKAANREDSAFHDDVIGVH